MAKFFLNQVLRVGALLTVLGLPALLHARMQTHTRSSVAVSLSAPEIPKLASSDSVPATPSGKLYVDMSGAPYVTSVINVPVIDAAGRPVSTVTEIRIYRAGALVHSVNPEGAPSVTVIDTVAQNNKKYIYQISAVNKYGESAKVRAEVFVGFDKPATPPAAYTSLSPDRKVMHMSWEPPTADANGKPIDPSKLKYQVRVRDANNKYIVLDKNFSGLSYDFVYNDSATQLFYPSIAAINEQGTGLSRGGEGQFMGNASKMPFRESWPGGKFKTPMLFKTEQGGFTFGVIRDNTLLGMPASDGDNGAYRLRATVSPGIGRLITNYIDVCDTGSPAYAINVGQISKFGGNPSIELIVRCDSIETRLAVFNLDSLGYNKWYTLMCPLDKYKGKRIQVIVRSTSDLMAFLMFDNVRVFDAAVPNAALMCPEFPEHMLPGRPYTFTAVASNLSAADISDASVELYRNGVKVSSSPISLPALSTQNISIDEIIPVLTQDSVFSYTLRLNLDGDVDSADNVTAEVSVPVLVDAPMPGVRGLVSGSSSVLNLSWNSPDRLLIPAERVTEDFESYQSNSANFGQWTSIDGDKRNNIMFSNNNIQLFSTEPAGFLVLDRSPWINEISFEPHINGIKAAASLTTNDDLPCDDWLISPRLNGAAQTVSLWACAYFKYKMPFEFYYSTQSKDLEDFIRMDSTTFNQQWKRFDYVVPEGTRYFAIHATHTFKYAGDGNSPLLIIDDVTFTPDGIGQADLLGYNVYCDGQLLTSTPVTETRYNGNLSPGTHEYQVTALFDRGESLPVSVSITNGVENCEDMKTAANGGKGEISFSVSMDSTAHVYNIQGALQATVNLTPGTTAVPLGPGIYIVRIGNSTHKVIVR